MYLNDNFTWLFKKQNKKEKGSSNIQQAISSETIIRALRGFKAWRAHANNVFYELYRIIVHIDSKRDREPIL